MRQNRPGSAALELIAPKPKVRDTNVRQELNWRRAWSPKCLHKLLSEAIAVEIGTEVEKPLASMRAAMLLPVRHRVAAEAQRGIEQPAD